MKSGDGRMGGRVVRVEGREKRTVGRAWGWGITLLAMTVPTTLAVTIPGAPAAFAATGLVARDDVACTDRVKQR